MSLKAFEFAKVEEAWLAELARGYLAVSEVANYPPGMQIIAIKDRLHNYRALHPGAIHAIFGSMECKLLIPDYENERHPDIAVYLYPSDKPTLRGQVAWGPKEVPHGTTSGCRQTSTLA